MSAIYNQKHVLHTIVGKNETYKAEDVFIDNYADLNDGNVVILDVNNYVRDTAAGDPLAAAEVLRIATRVGNELVYTPFFKFGDVVSMRSASYTAAVQQVTNIGYVGSGTGNIEAIDDNEYIVRILLEGVTAQFGNKQMYKFGAYKSSASATSAEVAIGLVDNLYYNFKREPQQMIQFDARCSATVTAANCFDNDVTVVQGLNYFTVGTSIQYNSTDAVVGDYVRLAEPAAATTALTDDVYEITSISSLTIYVDRPITSASGTYDAANDEAEVIPAATGVAALWGIMCTGIAFTNFSPGVFNYGITRFEVGLQDCGTTAVTYTTAGNPGVNVYGQIAELEWFAQGNLGKKWRVDTPPTTQYTQAASGSTYETIHFQYKVLRAGSDSVTGTTPDSYAEIVLAFVVNSDCGDKIFATLDEGAQVLGLPALTAWS